jgi:hypothetical protein
MRLPRVAPSWWVFGTSLLLGLVVVAVVQLAWLWAHQRHNEQLRQSRFEFSHHELRDLLESGLKLGQNLASMPNAQAQLEQAFGQHADIVSIDVVGPDGQIAYSTDARSLGARMQADWTAACMAAAGKHWELRQGDTLWRCVPLLDGIDRAAGALVLRHSQLSKTSVNSEQALAPTWWVGALLIVLLGALWAKRMSKALDAQLAAHLGHAMPDGHASNPAPQAMGPQWAQAQQAVADLERRFASIDDAANRLDQAEVG